MVDERDHAAIDQRVDRRPASFLEHPAERAQEVDVRVDHSRAATEHDPVAVCRGAGRYLIGWGDYFGSGHVNVLLGCGVAFSAPVH